MIRFPRPPVLALALGLAAGCKDSTGSSAHDRLSFSYGGAASGTFSASGPVPATSAPWSTQFAGGLQDADGYTLSAYAPNTATVGTRFVLVTYQPGGADTYSSDCASVLPTSRCFTALLFFDWDGSAPGTPAGLSLRTEHVTLHVASVTATRIKGTFSGTFVSGSGQHVTVPDGTFDLPLVQR
jgi:hypothetical protein